MIPGASRGIRIVQQDRGLPIVGRVAAGEPILSEENIDDYQEMSGSSFHPNADYFLRVQGESMGFHANDMADPEELEKIAEKIRQLMS